MSEQENNNETIQDPIEDNTTENQEETIELSVEEKLNAELAESKDKYIRLSAEFDNYRKRTSKERVELIQSAGKDVITKLLSTVDDFDRALKAMETATDVESIKTGIDIVNNKFRQTLEQQGLKEMDVLGKEFDADLQEAITAIPAPTPDLKNKVIDVIEKGYYLNDKVIRHAKVIIGQ
ncbi:MULTISPECIES: nucleotide exchange factor GrpE [Sphingobacterium]|jgi:molecular chaperone GrpE|uniref:nucleotide exchange factor GrpE n=1 Tax=Sphingobacterium TaxID=28453 RepID=UPI0004E5F23F|nr:MULTISPECIES: nucleotide exchange factor GrpE [Sphingobacterium]CDS92014.1 Protein GrpE [Sphingobacterium sp. PM2-P1-29]SJN52474.1 Heat shock protein GrpE [Sphingobacterium faecium PCAi_F2.5]UPZ36112.1 nucleotide exchange factor GrpE [Sphingobacterium sp. PCS056]UXD71647.1 nucleotide exchange factor GrpE [Sphingobacterium faecium]WGQ15305.1 nucleotide exchange factor GrpE [Sphingobacterium faecium]